MERDAKRMNPALKSLVGSMALGAVAALVYGASCLYSASQDDARAKVEQTAVAAIYVHEQGSDPQPLDALRCDYHFSVNGNPYVGHTICPRPSGEHPKQELAKALVGILDTPTITVYYLPNDPMVNSAVEFGAKKATDTLRAEMSFGLGGGLIFLLAVGMLVMPGAGGGGEIVDAEGGVIRPEKQDL